MYFYMWRHITHMMLPHLPPPILVPLLFCNSTVLASASSFRLNRSGESRNPRLALALLGNFRVSQLVVLAVGFFLSALRVLRSVPSTSQLWGALIRNPHHNVPGLFQVSWDDTEKANLEFHSLKHGFWFCQRTMVECEWVTLTPRPHTFQMKVVAAGSNETRYTKLASNVYGI